MSTSKDNKDSKDNDTVGGCLVWLVIIGAAGFYFFHADFKQAIDTKLGELKGGSESARSQPQTPSHPTASIPPVPTPTPVATPKPPPTGPTVRVVGRVTQRVSKGGLLVDCKAGSVNLLEVVERGLDRVMAESTDGDVTGTFLVVGHPKETAIVDNDNIRVLAREDGIYQYKTVLGSTRTVRLYRYDSEAPLRRGPQK